MRVEHRIDRTRRLGGAWFLALALLALAGQAASAQDREVVSKRIDVGANGSALTLEFVDGAPLSVALRDGRFRVGEEDAGASSPELAAAWQFLLGRAEVLDGSPLVAALIDWSPPADLEDEAEETGARIDRALEQGLSAEPAEPAEPSPATGARERSVVSALLGRRERLVELAEALEDVRLGDLQLHVAEEVTVEAGTELDGTIVVVDGNLEVAGVVDGDVIVVGGTVRLQDGGSITGDVRLADSRLYEDGGEVLGDVVEVDTDGAEALNGLLRNEIRREIESAQRIDRRSSSGFLAPFRYIGRGIAGVVSTMLTALVLGLIGGVVLHFGGSNLEIVAETARRSPARAAAVGLAGTFLVVPVWLLGAVALAVTVIGIPVMLFWLPLFPIAVMLAAGLGYYAVAHNVGTWIARRHYPSFGWVRLSNPYTLVAGGVLGLMAAFLVANALEIGGPWLGFLQGLVLVLGIGATVISVLVGFGSVLITRAGRRPEYYPGVATFGDDWDEDDYTGGGGTSWTPPPGPGPETPGRSSAGQDPRAGGTPPSPGAGGGTEP